VSGIAGIVRLDGGPVDRALLEKMAEFQAFRGPHGRGVWCAGNVGFVHTLFKLDDNDTPAPQPATLDGKVWITAHARVDAQDDLIGALRGRGREVVRGASDAELLLHAYHAWGDRCLEHVLGDFTFAIWDGRERRLFCAVDHFGIRPFYYAHIGDTLLFSNTLDCVRLYPSISEKLDDTAVGDFLLFGQYVDLDRTIYADVRRIPRAHRLIASRNGIEVRRYWEMVEEDELDDSDPEALVAEFRARLLTATRDRLRTRHVALSMSGGLDSTLVAACTAEALRESTTSWKITAFTTVFRELIADDEEAFARAAAKHLDIELRLQSGDDYVPFDSSTDVGWQPQEPHGSSSWRACVDSTRKIAQTNRLMLTGWEGDEPMRVWLPGRWRMLGRSGRWGRLRQDLWRYVRDEKGLPPVGFRTMLQHWRRGGVGPLPAWIAPQFAQRARLAHRWRQGWRDVQMEALRSGSRQKYLETVPWELAFHGYDPTWHGSPLEVAHPLMDLRVIAWLARVPEIPWCARKHLFRRAAQGLLPDAIVRRPKTPLSGDPDLSALGRHRINLHDVIGNFNGAGYVDMTQLEAFSIAKMDDNALTTFTRIVAFLAWLRRRRISVSYSANHSDQQSNDPKQKRSYARSQTKHVAGDPIS
jgi:asparagine synthase (glutamine-hydrolysing)